jgi:ubiquitin-protein ligase
MDELQGLEPMTMSDSEEGVTADAPQQRLSHHHLQCEDSGGELSHSLRGIIEARAKRRQEPQLTTSLIRMRKDLQQWQPQHGVSIRVCVDDPHQVYVQVAPAMGWYSSAVLEQQHCDRVYTFGVRVSSEYPFEPPRVVATPVGLWHPNVCLQTGRVLISLLGVEWSPIMSLGGLFDALQAMMEEPHCHEDVLLNPEAAHAWRYQPQAIVTQQQRYVCLWYVLCVFFLMSHFVHLRYLQLQMQFFAAPSTTCKPPPQQEQQQYQQQQQILQQAGLDDNDDSSDDLDLNQRKRAPVWVDMLGDGVADSPKKRSTNMIME